MRFAETFFSKVSFVVRLFAAAIYRSVFLLLRRTFYRPREPLRIPVVIVGAFRVGGSGKTPFVLELSRRLAEKKMRVAVLCHAAAWDEFSLLRSKCVGASMFKTRNRYGIAKRIERNFDVILCDGGLEDTRFSRATVFVLRGRERAKNILDLIPLGICASLEKDHPEAREIRCFRSAERKLPDARTIPPESFFCVSFGIAAIQNGEGKVPAPGTECSVVTAIGDPDRFAKDVESFGLAVSRKIFLPDHFRGYARALRAELRRGLPVVVTEKDAVRLESADRKNPKLFVASESVFFGRALDAYLNALFGGAFKNPPSML